MRHLKSSKHYYSNVFIFAFLLLLPIIGCSVYKSIQIEIYSPEDLYKDLFFAVQNDTIFQDSKTFVDCIPIKAPNEIVNNYNVLKSSNTFNLNDFISDNFIVPQEVADSLADSLSIHDHISALWSVLKRPPDSLVYGTLIPLPHSYIVPGGRFREVYYWDSFFTMLGLRVCHKDSLIEDMVDNFAFLIDNYGHIPNGNRTYYLSRSQPPYFSMMVNLLSNIKSDSVYMYYLPYLEKEYTFWMKGVDILHNTTDNAVGRIVKMPGGEILNRYWDEKATPRPESYREDRLTVSQAYALDSKIDTNKIYRDIRAAAESGWDFSSRWFAGDSSCQSNLTSIHTSDIVPVDLNCLLYYMEDRLAFAYRLNHNYEKSYFYENKCQLRKNAILKYFWNIKKGFFMDYDFVEERQTSVLSLAGIYPLFFTIATDKQALLVSENIRNLFLKDGGLVTTLNETGEQWDWPNGWAPLNWISIQALKYYKQDDLANEIRNRWIMYNTQVYNKSGKMVEKYNVVDTTLAGGGGEYPAQDGFGWTNGVYLDLCQ